IAYAALADLLPLNLAVFAFVHERGILTPMGLNRLAFMGLQAALVAFVTGAGGWLEAATADSLRQGLDALLHYRLFDPSFDAWTHLPQPAILLFALAFIVLLVRLVIVRSPLDAGSLGAMAASALALHMVGQGVASTVYFTVAALILLLGVTQDAYRMAFLDELTGLPGRRALVAAQKKLGGHYTAAMLDVDHFKSFNDTFGHDIGDQILKMVAARMGEVAGGGKSFRYGGEEFTVLFPNKGQNETALHLESLRRAIEASSFRLRGKDRPEEKPGRKKKVQKAKAVGVTVSIGMAERQAGEAPGDVLKRADEALYRAKEDGRNRLAG
ncbi:MAG TPA: GGDEF domain-containing protein, partial [Rhodospirillales bacterium]|nr:GGDEF domain-containing protein [Rhodospirillales bacterium]